MKRHLVLTPAFFSLGFQLACGQSLPATDLRATKLQDLNTPRTFPEISSRAEWQARAREIREQVLVSCGLWPQPEKTPLKAEVFGKIVRDGYSVEKVCFQSFPGFYVAGNLYRPVGRGDGPFPAVLNPHGHWKQGRFQDDELCSHAGRCINQAKQGMIAFSWDLVGYGDTLQVSHKFAADPATTLWGISLMGLQTWNSIRALDFLCSLPDVDPRRLACTGESGGGTQTFMLGAIDDRLAVQAPVVMVSHIMQGGCLCENVAGLRVDYSNMEIAAAAAPRPQKLVACTGDWTRATMTVEGPALARIYALFQAPEKLRYEIFDFNHNYNQTSRNAVYPWLGQWLLGATSAEGFRETAYKKEADADLRVWTDRKLPADALDEPAMIQSLIEQARAQWQALLPRDKKSLAHFKEELAPVWRHTLQLQLPGRAVLAWQGGKKDFANGTITTLALGRAGKGDCLPARLITPNKISMKTTVILAHGNGKGAYLDEAGEPVGLAKMLVERGQTVLLLDTFLTGELADPPAAAARKPFEKHFATYNRTDLQETVQDLVTACAWARSQDGRKVVLCGEGRAGLWVLLAAPAADAVVADAGALDAANDEALLTPALYVPGIRRLGAFEGAAALAAPHPLVLHNTGNRFTTDSLLATYAAADSPKSFQATTLRLEPDALADAIGQLKVK